MFDRYGEDNPHRKEEFLWARTVLLPGESILVCTKPTMRHLFRAMDIVVISFGIFWFCSLWFTIGSTIMSGSNVPVFLYGVFAFMLLMGLYMTVGQFLVKIWDRTHTEYVITNRRIIRSRGKKIDFRSYSAETSFHVRVNGDETGSLFFGAETDRMYYSRTGRSMNFDMTGTLFCLDTVPDVQRIYRILATNGG